MGSIHDKVSSILKKIVTGTDLGDQLRRFSDNREKSSHNCVAIRIVNEIFQI